MYRIFKTFFEENRDFWSLWIPVALGLGITLYFSLDTEPSLQASTLALIIATGGLFLPGEQKIFYGLFWAVLGFNASLWRTIAVNPNPLWASLPPLTLAGNISDVEHLPGESLGYRLKLEDLSSDEKRLPQAIKVTLKKVAQPLHPGDRIQVRVRLFPLQDPPSPYTYDWARRHFFQGIGATGLVIGAPIILKKGLTTPLVWRQKIGQTFLKKMPEPMGALANALVTGDKSSLKRTYREAFINAGIAHLLAISGLHLSIVGGFFFVLTQSIGILIPSLALRLPMHKVASCVALFGITLYSGLSGGATPVRRAFIMTGLFMIGLVMDRKPVALRLLCVAASLILLLTPEMLLEASFQFSFAATLSLIVVYKGCLTSTYWIDKAIYPTWLRKIFVYIAGSLCASIASIVAITPYEIFHFHRITAQGIVANFFAIPLMTFLVLPLAVLSCVAIVLHIEDWVLPYFTLSLKSLYYIANTISKWPGAFIPVGSFTPWALPLITVGGLWLYLIQGPWRWFGLLGVVGIFFIAKPPDLIIESCGQNMGFYERETETLWVFGKGRFTPSVWMQSAGLSQWKKLSPGIQQDGWQCDKQSCFYAAKRVLLAKDARQSPWCQQAKIIFSAKPVGRSCPQGELLIDPPKLKRYGSHALWLEQATIVLQTSRMQQGQRPWTRF